MIFHWAMDQLTISLHQNAMDYKTFMPSYILIILLTSVLLVKKKIIPELIRVFRVTVKPMIFKSNTFNENSWPTMIECLSIAVFHLLYEQETAYCVTTAYLSHLKKNSSHLFLTGLPDCCSAYTLGFLTNDQLPVY